jgi:hypothetical protein
MRKASQIFSVAGAAAVCLGLLPVDGSAQSHWFYGNYGHYDGMTWGVFPPPPPTPYYPPAASRYEDPYGEPAPAYRPHHQRPRYAYQPPPSPDESLDPAPEGEPGARSHAAQPVTPRKPKAGAAALASPDENSSSGNAADASTHGSGSVSCDKARGIVADFGFKDIKADSCSGKTYGFSATRDGKAFSIKIVAANGELAEVRRQ